MDGRLAHPLRALGRLADPDQVMILGTQPSPPAKIRYPLSASILLEDDINPPSDTVRQNEVAAIKRIAQKNVTALQIRQQGA